MITDDEYQAIKELWDFADSLNSECDDDKKEKAFKIAIGMGALAFAILKRIAEDERKEGSIAP